VVLGDVEEEFGDCGLVVRVCLGGFGGGGDEGQDGGGYEGEFVALWGVSLSLMRVKDDVCEAVIKYLQVVVS
jgi:hypothetical protein